MGKLVDSLKNAVGDLASLEVITFTGVMAVTATEAKTLNLDEAFDKIDEAGTTVTIVANTKINLDGDVRQFIADGIDEALLKAHQDAVNAGQDTRNAIFNLIKSTIQGML